MWSICMPPVALARAAWVVYVWTLWVASYGHSHDPAVTGQPKAGVRACVAPCAAVSASSLSTQSRVEQLLRCRQSPKAARCVVLYAVGGVTVVNASLASRLRAVAAVGTPIGRLRVTQKGTWAAFGLAPGVAAILVPRWNWRSAAIWACPLGVGWNQAATSATRLPPVQGTGRL